MDRLDEITKDCFNALIQIRQLDPQTQPPPEVLHQRFRSFVDTMINRGKDEKGFSVDEMKDIAYAIVSLIDEMALSIPGPVRQYWTTRPLQLHYFQSNVAGEQFFQRLDEVRRDPRRLDVLRVYYLCLMFGFQGKYRIRGGEVELGSIIDGVQQDLARAKVFGPDSLSPYGERPKEAQAKTKRDLPLIWFGVAAVLLAVGFYVFMRFSLGSEVGKVIQRIQEVNRQSAPNQQR